MNGIAALLLACSPEPDPVQLETLPSLPSLPAQQEAEPKDAGRDPVWAAIALVGEVRGELEPCGCPSLPYGGFLRRENYLEGLRSGLPTFHLDAGEMLLKGFSNVGQDRELRARSLARLSEQVGVDAWAVGPGDLDAMGLETLKSMEGPPRISATWTDLEGEWLFPPSAVIERGGIRLGVIGLSARPMSTMHRNSIGYLDSEEAISRALDGLPGDLDLVVALGSVDDDDAAKAAAMEPDVAALLTTRGATYEEPYRPDIGMPLVIEAPERGRYVQTAYIRIGASSSFPLSQSSKPNDWRDWIELRARKAAGYEDKELSETERRLAKEGDGRNLAYTELVALNRSYDGEAAVSSELEAFKNEALKAAAQRASEPQKGEKGYASASQCARCHSREFARWTLSDHAEAWQSLLLRDEQGNPECIQCHSTGFGKPGGLGELVRKQVRKYKAVQCESCHGPMGGHPGDPEVRPIPIGPETCLECHDEANSPDFEFESYLKRGQCQMH
jgi:hypothetical protein